MRSTMVFCAAIAGAMIFSANFSGASAQSGFDVTSVAESTAALPPFPFFKTPDDLKSIYDNDKEKNSSYDRQYFIAGDKLIAVEGKVFHDAYNLNGANGHTYSELEFQKNYENAITALGGVKINTTGFTDANVKAAGGEDTVNKYYFGACPTVDCTNDSYLIRKDGEEYWINVSTGRIPTHGFVTVLERKGMKQSVGYLTADEMKKALDANGHVALYINFDTDKATLRPDATPIIGEIVKLMTANPDLKLSVEGHTDNTGTAAHNQTLSEDRAKTVVAALTVMGISADRLRSKGFGQTKPIADNATDAGRAKNRRVELVKVN